MQSLVHADIFFFISTIALAVLGSFVAIGLYFLIGILRDVKEITARVNKASEHIENDLNSLRSSLRAEGSKVKGIADLLLGYVVRAVTPKVRRKKQKEEDY